MRRNDEYDERGRNISPLWNGRLRGENGESRKEEDMKKETESVGGALCLKKENDGQRERETWREREREGTVAGG